MPVTAEIRCGRCDGDFSLFELLDTRSGSCPRCGRRLTDDWAPVLIEEAARVDLAQRQLAKSLRRLRSLPGTFVVLPHSILRNVSEALGWDAPVVDDGGSLDDQRKLLLDLASSWSLPAEEAWPRPSRWQRLQRAVVRSFESASRRHVEAAMAPYQSVATATIPIRPRRLRRVT